MSTPPSPRFDSRGGADDLVLRSCHACLPSWRGRRRRRAPGARMKRSELYARVWAEPMIRVAADLGTL